MVQSQDIPLSIGPLGDDGLFGGEAGLDGIDESELTDRPVTGEPIPELAALDEVMLSYMNDRNIPTGVLGIAHEGELVLKRGYGWQDRSLSTPVAPDTLFRIGSISKSLTDAAIYRLVEAGLLSLDDHVISFLDIERDSSTVADERVYDITIEHLIDHQGGWDRLETSDPPFEPRVLLEELETTAPPTTEDVARWVLNTPLQFDPGTETVYSNVGYCLLELVIEAVTGRDYNVVLRDRVLDPVGIDDELRPAATLADDRPDREIWYADPTDCPDMTTPESGDRTTCANGGFRMSLLRAAAGHVGSTTGLLSYLDAYTLSGETGADNVRRLWYYGSLPGAYAWAEQRSDDIDVVALFNRRGRNPKAIGRKLKEAIDEIEEWP
jgi:N-acyl-D-amino-acid deacylase